MSYTVLYSGHDTREAFDVAFLLFPRLFVGILNKSAWITITKEEWKPT